ALSENFPYDVELGWSASGNDGSFDLLLQRRGDSRTDWIEDSSSTRKKWREYGNDPLRGSSTRGLVPRLREFLSERLPEAMVPSDFVLLEELPLNASGKVDRRALPSPERRAPGLESGYVVPRGPIEEGVASIWKDVLKLERIGAHDDFFELGGHSLLATSIVTRVRDAFQVDLPLRSLFESPTVAGIAERVERDYRTQEIGAAQPPILAPSSRSVEGELSFAQTRMWFLSRLEPSSPAYNIHGAIRLRGTLDHRAFEESLREMVQRHQSLRTTFGHRDGRPFQRISEEETFELPRIDLKSSSDPEADARRAAREEASTPFDLERGPLVRTKLLELAPDDHVLLLTMHHIVSDGWSIGVFFREWGLTYGAFSSGGPSPLAELPVQYADFARWQREWLEGELLERQLSYWKGELQGVTSLDLPTDRPRPTTRTYRGGRRTMTLPAALSGSVRELSHREGATLFMTLLALYQILLFRYTGQEDIAVGTPIAGRNRSEIEGLIGFFVNTLVLRSDLSGRPSFRDLLSRVRERALGAYAHQDLPFEKLVEELSPERSLGQNPLFQTIFAFQNAPIEGLVLKGLALSVLETETGSTRLDLEMHVWDRLDGLKLTVSYDRDLFEEATIDRLLGHYRALLESAVSNPKARIVDLELLTDSERRHLLALGQGIESEYPRDQNVAEVFEARAAERPEAIAVVCEDREIRYSELNRRANRLAHYLRSMGVQRDEVVAIAAARSERLIVGLLGILKAGGAYLPLDPDYPAERLSFMLEDSGAKILLTERETEALLPGSNVPSISLDSEKLSGFPAENPHSAASASHLAYVTYTSGSTGIPKGVEVPHRGILRLLFGVDYVSFGPSTTILHLSAISFDASTFEIWGALLHGGRVVVHAEKLASFSDLQTVIERERVTTMWLTASLFNATVDH
ncbi:MAG: condensation domain-containing protein, partial [Vicinamibacteria bacterium]